MADPYQRWWRRGPHKRGQFSYQDAFGRPITDERKLARIRALRLPPGWSDVRVSPTPKAKLQAVGLDAKGRRQYVYHADWVKAQAEAKFQKLVAFAAQLPHFRAVTSAHLALPGLPRERVLALVARLISEACFRIGSERYVRENESYGIATLCTRHVRLSDTCLRFVFRGKRGIMHEKIVADPALVALMREVASQPGRRLFQYRRDDGSRGAVTDRDVNRYLKDIMGPAFSAKDFRTWGGTLMAARILAAYGPADTARARKRALVNTVRAVSRYLGNTPAIARASYICPIVLDCYEQGRTLKDYLPRRGRQVRLLQEGFTPEEVELMRMLSAPQEVSSPPQVAVTWLPAEAPVEASPSA